MAKYYKTIDTSPFDENLKLIFGNDFKKEDIKSIPFFQTYLVEEFVKRFENRVYHVKVVDGEYDQNESCSYKTLDEAQRVMSEVDFLFNKKFYTTSFELIHYLSFERIIWSLKYKFKLLNLKDTKRYESYLKLRGLMRRHSLKALKNNTARLFEY